MGDSGVVNPGVVYPAPDSGKTNGESQPAAAPARGNQNPRSGHSAVWVSRALGWGLGLLTACLGLWPVYRAYQYLAGNAERPKTSLVEAAAWLAVAVAVLLGSLSFRQYHRYRSELQAMIDGKLDKQIKADGAAKAAEDKKSTAVALTDLTAKIDKLTELMNKKSAG